MTREHYYKAVSLQDKISKEKEYYSYLEILLADAAVPYNEKNDYDDYVLFSHLICAIKSNLRLFKTQEKDLCPIIDKAIRDIIVKRMEQIKTNISELETQFEEL